MLTAYIGMDHYMKHAVRKIDTKKLPIICQVIAGFAPDTAHSVPIISNWMENAKQPIRFYTHADCLSDAAIRNVMYQAEKELPKAAVFFVNMKDCDKIKTQLVQRLIGAFDKGIRLHEVPGAVRGHEAHHILMCGLPNSGKSSIILPLTRHAVVTTKKKKHTHVAKVSIGAGRTASVKTHRLATVFNQTNKTGTKSTFLVDSPGLLPSREEINLETLIMLTATLSLTPSAYLNHHYGI